jgi:hypothetical protein
VTICIAAACNCYRDSEKSALVFALDRSISLGGMTSVETGVKGRHLHDTWNAMFAGNDVSHVETVIRSVCASLLQNNERSLAGVSATMVETYQRVRQKQVEDIYLSPLGWNLEQFINRGRKLLPSSEYARILSEIQRYELGCEFLVGGFEPSAGGPRSARIFQVVNPGTIIPNDMSGFSAIGSGSINAYAYLARREQQRKTSLAETVYNVIAAKILAEKAIGIGRETHVVVIRNGEPTQTHLRKVDRIREIWEKEEEDIRPRQLEERVSEILNHDLTE